MNDTIKDAIAKQLEGLELVVPEPSGDLGYGNDLSCIDDVTEDLAEVDPLSPRGIGEAAIRRLTTPRGSLLDEPEYGFDVRGYVNRGITFAELQELEGRCALELAKDDRIETASVVVLTDLAARSLSLSIYITPASTAFAPFSLTFAVGETGQITLEALA